MTTETKIEEGVLVDDEGNVIQQEPVTTEAPAEAAPEDDERLSDQHEDDQAQEGETEEEAEARRQHNRERRAENKKRRQEYVESLKREIAARDEVLRQQSERLDALERRSNGADMAMVDTEMRKAADAYNFFKTQHSEAVNASNGQLATEAQERMFQAARRFEQLKAIKDASQRSQSAPQQQPLDPRIRQQAEKWLDKNRWYDPQGADADSQIALTLDRQLNQEGWNPTTPQYWEELDSRIKKYLPHRYKSGYNVSQGKNQNAPVAGSGRENSGKATGYRLTADRVQAIKDAGKWDDPKERAAMIKAYQDYDKQQTA